ncbi:MAG: hypothetical protein IJ297_00300 [Clostridia bacterium]|nr:hypothetical protein [Clostridia bacterium]
MIECTQKEHIILKQILEEHSEELSVIKRAISEPKLITKINQDKALVYDRIIGELLDDFTDDNTIIGTAFILGTMQGIISERKKNSDQRTTANRSI